MSSSAIGLESRLACHDPRALGLRFAPSPQRGAPEIFGRLESCRSARRCLQFADVSPARPQIRAFPEPWTSTRCTRASCVSRRKTEAYDFAGDRLVSPQRARGGFPPPPLPRFRPGSLRPARRCAYHVALPAEAFVPTFTSIVPADRPPFWELLLERGGRDEFVQGRRSTLKIGAGQTDRDEQGYRYPRPRRPHADFVPTHREALQPREPSPLIAVVALWSLRICLPSANPP